MRAIIVARMAAIAFILIGSGLKANMALATNAKVKGRAISSFYTGGIWIAAVC